MKVHRFQAWTWAVGANSVRILPLGDLGSPWNRQWRRRRRLRSPSAGWADVICVDGPSSPEADLAAAALLGRLEAGERKSRDTTAERMSACRWPNISKARLLS